MLHMDGAGGDEGVNTLVRRFGQRLSRLDDIPVHGPGQRADRTLFDHLSDPTDRVEVAGAGGRETRLDDIDAQSFELHGDLYLLFGVHRGSGALFPVSECGVEYIYFIFFHSSLSFCLLKNLMESVVVVSEERR